MKNGAVLWNVSYKELRGTIHILFWITALAFFLLKWEKARKSTSWSALKFSFFLHILMRDNCGHAVWVAYGLGAPIHWNREFESRRRLAFLLRVSAGHIPYDRPILHSKKFYKIAKLLIFMVFRVVTQSGLVGDQMFRRRLLPPSSGWSIYCLNINFKSEEVKGCNHW